MKTILIATDYSKAADNALEYAAALARYSRAKLVIFNAFQPPPPISTASMAVPGINKLLTENRARLQSLASRTSQFHGIETEWVTNISYVEEELPKQVKKHMAELVVMGMKGHSLDRRLFGSTTTSVIGRLKYPVLVVPEGVNFNGIARILFACDYKYLSSNSKLRFLKNLSRDFNAQVQVFHVDKPAEQPVMAGNSSAAPVSTNMEQVLRNVQHSYRDLTETDVIKGIEQGIQDFHADLLVMVPHKPGFWDMIFNKSNTRKMALKSPVPLLALPQE